MADEPQLYEPHEDDPPALLRDCPVCPALAGQWCGGFGDVHEERDPDAA